MCAFPATRARTRLDSHNEAGSGTGTDVENERLSIASKVDKPTLTILTRPIRSLSEMTPKKTRPVNPPGTENVFRAKPVGVKKVIFELNEATSKPTALVGRTNVRSMGSKRSAGPNILLGAPKKPCPKTARLPEGELYSTPLVRLPVGKQVLPFALLSGPVHTVKEPFGAKPLSNVSVTKG